MILNVVLLAQLFTSKNPPSTSPETLTPKAHVPSAPPVNGPPQAETQKSVQSEEFTVKPLEDYADPAAEKEARFLYEKMETDFETFLTGELQLSAQEMEGLSQISHKFRERQRRLIPESTGSLTIQQRRKLLELDEEKERALMKHLGEQRWKRFKEFQENYSKKLYENAAEGVLIPPEP